MASVVDIILVVDINHILDMGTVLVVYVAIPIISFADTPL